MATINNGTNTNIMTPLDVKHGGTGINTHKLNGLLIGSGKDPITSIGVASNGQLPIGRTGSSPVLSTLTAGTGIVITNDAGSITIATPITYASAEDVEKLAARVKYLERRCECNK